jgi:hypothetical protein
MLLLTIAATFSALGGSEPDSGSSLSEGPRVTAPHGVRIKVQVINTTGKTGLAARATRYLRDRGFDVVAMGSSSKATDTTVVIDRSGRNDWARLVARSLGVARVESHPAEKLFLDVTVQLGTDWVAPTGPFDP